MVAAVFALSGCTGGSVDPAARYDGVDAEVTGDPAAALQQVLVDAVALSGSSGGVASVSAPWAGDWSGAVGVVGFDEGAATTTPDSRFRMAGVSSMVTCLLLMRLVDAGTVALDDQVGQYVDDMPGLDGITLEQLCSHESGLADYRPSLYAHFIHNPERVWSRIELISAGVARDRVGAPGQLYSYSDTGLLLLAVALERASHRDWNDLVRQYVLEPLDLEDTELPAADTVAPDGVIGAYVSPPGADGAPDCAARVDDSRQSSSMGGEASGLVSSLDDAVVLAQANAGGALVGEHSYREQWATELVPGAAPWVSQGIGGTQYGPLRGTASATVGVLTAAFSDPETGLTVVISVNNSSSGQDFIREASFALASIASKLPAAEGQAQPLIELPWSVEQAREKMTQSARCSTPAA
ncbi:serine hydrolase [Agromyces sp. LHK192]|uniref:serine hydrolase domain-containing protein n=1 Tax=Agromyces sp. LHK192 TaxID=2498704 RepID=UPI000FDC432C|nr:serine hydrolase domain-containing protein [Agromyces sp. LHK192]